MPTLSGMTLQQLRAATVGQIQTAMKNRIDALTKRQLIRLDLWCASFDKDAQLTIADEPQVTYRPDGQIEKCIRVARDALGAKVGSEEISWSYFPAGEVDVIVLRALAADGREVKRRTIQHYRDGRQPTVESD